MAGLGLRLSRERSQNAKEKGGKKDIFLEALACCAPLIHHR